jgi:hypothetical protein
MSRSNYATTGMSLLWFALALDGLAVVLTWHHLSPGFVLAHLPILSVIGFLIWWFITLKVSEGSTWARIVYLVFTVLGVLGMIGISLIPGLATWVFSMAGTGGFLEVGKLVLQVAGIALLFSAPAIRR